MPFELKNALATFQRALNITLSEVRWQIFLVYLDDVIVFSRANDEDIELLDRVLSLAQQRLMDATEIPLCAIMG